MGCVRGSVEAAALLPSLRCLDIRLGYLDREVEGDEILIQPVLLHRGSRLTALTALSFNVFYIKRRSFPYPHPLPVPVLARAVSLLRRLRIRMLDVGLYALESQAEWRDMLAPLQLVTFITHGAMHEHEELLLELLLQLQHLHRFEVYGILRSGLGGELEQVAEDLPGRHSCTKSAAFSC